jgi:translation initiation factor 2 alpha subunit (eIF-2alpha)
VNSILRHVADLLDIDMEKLSEETAWKLAKVYGNMYEAFKRSITYVESAHACRVRYSVWLGAVVL